MPSTQNGIKPHISQALIIKYTINITLPNARKEVYGNGIMLLLFP